MKKLLLCALWSFCVLFSGLWAQNIQKTVAEIVPDSAYMVITVERPREVLNQWENFLKPLTVLQGKTLTKMIDEWEVQSGFPFSQLDWDSSWVAGVSQKAASMDAVVALPLKNKEKALAGLKKVLASGGMKLSTYSNYAILFPATSTPPKLPQKKGFDVSSMKAVNSDGVTVYAKLASFTMNGRPLSDVIRSGLENEGELTGAQGEAAKKMLGDFLKLWDEGIGLGSSLVVNAKGTGLFFWTDFQPNGTAQKALKSLPPTSGTREFYKYLDPSALISGVGNFDPAALWAIEKYFDDLYQTDVAGYDDYKKLLKDRSTYMGKRGAFNLDLDLDAEKVKALAKKSGAETDDETIEALVDAFELRLFGAFEVKDVKAFRANEKLLFGESGVQKVMNNLFQQANIPVAISYQFKANQKDGSFEFDQMNLAIEVSAGDIGRSTIDEKTAANINKACKKFFDENPLYYSYASGKAYFYMGKQGLVKLKDFVKKDGLSSSWSTDKQIGAWKDYLPDDSSLTFSFSVNRLFGLMKKTGLENLKTLPELSPGPGVLFYGKVRSSGNLEGGMFSSSEDIQLLVNYFSALMAPKPKASSGTMGGRKSPPQE